MTCSAFGGGADRRRRKGDRTLHREARAPAREPTNLINARNLRAVEAAAIARIARGDAGCRSSGRSSLRWSPRAASSRRRTPTYWIDNGDTQRRSCEVSQFEHPRWEDADNVALTPLTAGGGGQIFGGEDARIDGEFIGLVLLRTRVRRSQGPGPWSTWIRFSVMAW